MQLLLTRISPLMGGCAIQFQINHGRGEKLTLFSVESGKMGKKHDRETVGERGKGVTV